MIAQFKMNKTYFIIKSRLFFLEMGGGGGGGGLRIRVYFLLKTGVCFPVILEMQICLLQKTTELLFFWSKM